MSFRRAAAGLLRRLRFESQTVTATSYGRTPNAGKLKISCHYHSGQYTRTRQRVDLCLKIFLSGQAALILGINACPVLAEDASIELSSENDSSGASMTGLRRIEDGSVISNIHTSKWRVFTDTGRDLFLQGKLEEAEKLFLSALQEAKEGFGERDPHVASACNNLAELYRVKRAFDKAEPLYLDAIKILEESLGQDDIRVGVALHNLGQFYLVQRKLEDARVCYDRALKIKRRVLGPVHSDYADTMYHLGTVLYLQGKEMDSEDLIKDSIRILEEGGQGESILCIRRLRYLAQMYIKSNQPAEAENVQRKILHILELSKGWNSLDTVIAAEGLALILQSIGRLNEAQEILERCLKVRKTLLPEDHIQIAANILHIARVKIHNSDKLRKTNVSEAIAELEKAKDLLGRSKRIAEQVLDKFMKQKGSHKYNAVPGESGKNNHAAFVILLQSLKTLGLLEIKKQELQESWKDHPSGPEAENAFHQCISAFKEFGNERPMSNSHEAKAEYLSCLKHLLTLFNNSPIGSSQLSRRSFLQELKDEIKRVEVELPPKEKHGN
ncbi:uncharacterized protein LOC132282943 [Cornus florida]|uniref:uncharacterized protein LOC132282943 n=1 Tax=Cornus florida TaxID=4283 RepID=UPI0028A05CD1|nr:uncharacterized protein LOC132282943 [Cornus florida]